MLKGSGFQYEAYNNWSWFFPAESTLIPEKLLNQYGGFWGFLTYDHRYIFRIRREQRQEWLFTRTTRVIYVPFWDYSIYVEASYVKL